MFTGIIVWIALGALAGWIASIVAGVNRQQGALRNVMFGVFGAVVGGLAVSISSDVPALNVSGLIIAIVGAIGALAIVSGFKGLEE